MRSKPQTTDAFSLLALEPRALLSYDSVTSIPGAYGLTDLDAVFAPPDTVPDDDPAPFGTAAAGIGDVNGDGIDDVIIGWPTRGNAHVYSGKTHTRLYTLQTATAGFGRTLAAVGDVDGDGRPDIAVGAGRTEDPNGIPDLTGMINIYSGATGTLIHSYTGENPTDEFGYSVAAAGDLNGDGRADFFIGAPGRDGGRGRVLGYSGLDGALAYFFDGEAAGDRFGQAISAGVDMPTNIAGAEGLDGKPEFLIGAPGFDGTGADRGRIYYYLGANRALSLTFDGAADGDVLGTGVALVNDGPGLSAIIAAAPGVDIAGTADVGSVTAFNIDHGTRVTRTGDGATPGASFIGKQLRALSRVTSNLTTIFYTGTEASLGLYESADLNPIKLGDGVALGPAISLAVADMDGDGISDFVARLNASMKAKSSFLIFNDTIRGSSDNGRYLWGGAYNRPSYLVTDGVRRSTAAITGLGRAAIYSVNNNGDLLGAELSVVDGKEKPGRQFIFSNGAKTYIDQATVTQTGGAAPEFENFIPLELGNGGHAIFNEQFSQGGFRAWIYTNGTLRFLWSGLVYDVNTSGNVTGLRVQSDGNQVVYGTDTTGTTIPAMTDAGVLTDDNVVYGVGGNFLTAWTQAGGAVDLIAFPSTGVGRIIDADNYGRVLFSNDASATLSNVSIYHRRDNVIIPAGSYNPNTLRDIALPSLNDGKWIVRPDEIAKANIVTPIMPDSPLSSAITNSGLLAVGVHENGHLMMWEQLAFGWKPSYLAYTDTPTTDIITYDAEIYRDPRDGVVRVLAVTNQGTYWFTKGHVDSPDKLPTLLIPPDAANAFSGRVASFISPDGRVHMVGLNADGEFLMLYQNSLAAPDSVDNWTVSNLSEEQFEQQGLATPTFAANLTYYASPWGSMHIIGLDDGGRLQVVWWAPGLPLWRTDDLTSAAEAPALEGDITALTTPWGAVHIGAVDPEGRALNIWWAPDNPWRTTILADANFARGPLAAYSTSWGGLNFVGLDQDTGNMVAVWWAPGLLEWGVSNVGGPTGLTSDEIQAVTLTAGTDGSDRVSILFRNTKAVPTDQRYQTGHLTALSWKPGQVFWAPEDLSLEI